MKIKISILNIIEYCYVFLLILSTSTIYYRSASHNYYIDEIIVIFSLILILLAKKNNRNNIGKVILYIVLYLLITIIFFLVNNVAAKSNFIYIFILLYTCSVLRYSLFNDNNYIKNILLKFSNIMFLLAIMSLFFYVLGPLLNILKPSGVEIINWGGEKSNYSIYNLYFYRQTQNVFGKILYRNTGIFTEAPMYSLCLVIALAIKCFIVNKKKLKDKIILFVTILSTFSATGIIISIILLFIYFVKDKKKYSRNNVLKILFIPIILYIVLVVTSSVYNHKKDVDSDSYNTRMDDYIATFYAWKEYPIIGSGYQNIEIIENYMSNFRKENKGISNSVMIVLAQGGIWLELYYLVPFILLFCYEKKRKNWNTIVFLITLLVLFFTTTFQYSPLIMELLAMASSIILNRKNVGEEK